MRDCPEIDALNPAHDLAVTGTLSAVAVAIASAVVLCLWSRSQYSAVIRE